MSEPIPVLPHKHLTTLRLQVDTAHSAQIGATPNGHRTIAPIKAGTFSGDRLNGNVLNGGADWVRTRPDGALIIDVRLTLKTDDEALIYLSYEGRFIGGVEAMQALARGQTLDPDAYSLLTVAKFECGADRYSWLNDVIAVGVGTQSGFNPVYTIYQIG